MTEAQTKTYDIAGRETERHSCRLKARYRVLYSVPNMGVYHGNEVYEEGWLRNRSFGGVLLETTHHIPEGHKLELNYHSPDGRDTFRAEAVVRWVRKQANRDFLVGLQFHTIQTL